MSRNVGVFSMIFLFVCLNMGSWMLNEFEVLGDYKVEMSESPLSIQEHLASINVIEGLFMGAVSITIGILIKLLTGNLVYGGTAVLVIFALEIFFPMVRWIVAGFPIFLLNIGAPPQIVTVIGLLQGVVWFWFIFSVLSGRVTET